MLRSCLLALILFALGAPAAAQVVTPDTLPPDTIPRETHAPRNAFLKALVIPGWGHYSIGAPRRGLFFTATQGASWYMLIKTLRKLGRVQDRDDELTGLATDSLQLLMAGDTAIARELSDPEAFEAALLTYPGLSNARALRETREQQRQDWISYTVALTLAASIDAYVAAHLRNFPAAITTETTQDGGMALRFDVPVGGRAARP